MWKNWVNTTFRVSLAFLVKLERERERRKDMSGAKVRRFNFFWVDWVMAKNINHRGRGECRELLFLCVLYALCGFSKTQFRKIIKSLAKVE